jgi:hypothetical protein
MIVGSEVWVSSMVPFVGSEGNSAPAESIFSHKFLSLGLLSFLLFPQVTFSRIRALGPVSKQWGPAL